MARIFCSYAYQKICLMIFSWKLMAEKVCISGQNREFMQRKEMVPAVLFAFIFRKLQGKCMAPLHLMVK